MICSRLNNLMSVIYILTVCPVWFSFFSVLVLWQESLRLIDYAALHSWKHSICVLVDYMDELIVPDCKLSASLSLVFRQWSNILGLGLARPPKAPTKDNHCPQDHKDVGGIYGKVRCKRSCADILCKDKNLQIQKHYAKCQGRRLTLTLVDTEHRSAAHQEAD